MTTVRVFVCGEGRHDIGTAIDEIRYDETEGWLQCLLRRLLGDEVEFVAVRRNRLVIQRREQRKYRPLPMGHGTKALAAKLRAKAEGFDIVVFMADADSRRVRDWRRIRDQIYAGFDFIDGVAAVPCVPMSTSESWLLSDIVAWVELGLVDESALPRRPEHIWGSRTDSGSNHPHQYFRRVCENAGVSDSQDTRVQLALRLNVDTVRRACPTSFDSFVTEIHAMRV